MTKSIETKPDIDGDSINLSDGGNAGVIVFQYDKNRNGKGSVMSETDAARVWEWLGDWLENRATPKPYPDSATHCNYKYNATEGWTWQEYKTDVSCDVHIYFPLHGPFRTQEAAEADFRAQLPVWEGGDNG